MRKIIDGKMYNTETAKPIYLWTNGLSNRDFSNCSEFLYRKRTDEFFIHGWGGAMSKYREQCDGNMWGSGEDIVPLTESEAKRWVEEKADVNTYIDLFGEPEE